MIPTSEQQQEIVRFLGRAESHGLEGGTVEEIETHSAIVFLAGERVYKMKRAVDLGFLDYSTLALRERYCRAEVELNRRTAPELYLGVCPVTRGGDGTLALDGQGEAVEWLVVMRRFDQSLLFDRMAQRGELTPPLMRRVADQIAAFHDHAEIVESRHGADDIRAVIDGNRQSFDALPGGMLNRETVERTLAASRRQLDRIPERLDGRAGRGCVRVCHGDLHLRNICQVNGRPTLFDCIEFNPDLARIDVLYDLAFLLMDLVHRGLGTDANVVLNRYLDRREEDDGLVALPLFMSVRAAIRAHVGARAATQQSAAEAAARRAEARSYLELAGELVAAEAPVLVAVGGLSGSGKSSVAYALAPSLGGGAGARVLRSDVLRKRRFGVAPEVSLPPEAYDSSVSLEVHANVLDRAEALLRDGVSVVIDMLFTNPQWRESAEQVAMRAGAEFSGLWLEAPRDVLAERISRRCGDASDATPTVLASQLDRGTGELTWERLDAGRPFTEVVEMAARVVGVTPAGPSRPNPVDPREA